MSNKVMLNSRVNCIVRLHLQPSTAAVAVIIDDVRKKLEFDLPVLRVYVDQAYS